MAAYLFGESLHDTTGSTSSWSRTQSTMNSTPRPQAFTQSVANTIGRMQGFGGMGGYARGSLNRTQAKDFRRTWDEIRKAELGHPFGDIMGGVSTPLNTEELSIIMNVPRQGL